MTIMSKKEMFNATAEVAKEIAKNVYNDAGKPVAKPTGELVGLIPRAIKAALSPLEKWVLQREYNVAETKKLLEEKLQNTPPELIESPEPHIAVPAMQYISYCMDNEELREMYANLLANSMNKIVKKGVHPGFVEIIKQLCPDEAKLLDFIHQQETGIPIIFLQVRKTTGGTLILGSGFTDIAGCCRCENPLDCEKYFDNLERLGLIKRSQNVHFVNRAVYDSLKKHHYIVLQKKHAESRDDVVKVDYIEGVVELTDFGQAFCSICLSS